ncbi:unnamed protein product, partial [Brassica rapa]
DGRPVAVKRLTVSGLIKSQEEFESEMRKLGKLRHMNVVEIKGYYWTQSLRLLIFEFVSGEAYTDISRGGTSVIILGIARGLAYLHGSNITHYNLKATNVLIDAATWENLGWPGYWPRSWTERIGVQSPGVCMPDGQDNKEARCVRVWDLGAEGGDREEAGGVMVLCETVREGLEEGRVEECVDSRLRANFLAEEAIPVIKQEEYTHNYYYHSVLTFTHVGPENKPKPYNGLKYYIVGYFELAYKLQRIQQQEEQCRRPISNDDFNGHSV